jgi:hypothetical protein
MTDKKLRYLLLLTVGMLFLIPQVASAKGNGKESRKLNKVFDSQVANTRIDINNVNALQSNIGYSDYNLNSALEGTEFPSGSGKTAIFESGFLWGGFPNGDTSQVYVGGSAYITGLEPGPINSDGTPADPTDSRWSIYRVRPDVYPGGPTVDLSKAAALEGESASDIRAQYESDWKNWPAKGTANDLGAPFTDVNGDGKYEPDVDIPGVPGADQTTYWVANDEDGSLTAGLYGTPPLGLEIHVTCWAYAQQGALGNMYFKKFSIINKGKQKYSIDSMFVSFWADVDLGTATDDLVGCDTTLSLDYCYNGYATDAVYSPLPPPADGFDFFQGPLVQATASDSGIFSGQVIHGKRNLPMTAAYFFINGNANFGDPPQGEPTGATQFYHFFNGEYGVSGAPFLDNNGKPTKFAFPGDPVTGTGWVDGVTFAPADRRQGMASGPFNMAPGDTQEVVVAEIFAGAIPGVDRLSAISLLKFYDQTAQAAYDNFFQLATPPPPPHLNGVALKNKVVLDWGENLQAVRATEGFSSKGYKFEGYNIYQLPSASATIDQAKRLATYDVADGVLKIFDSYFDASSGVVLSHVSEFGNDTGIQRDFIDSTDAFNSNNKLKNGINYYFAVTSYSYNPDGVPHAIENPLSIITLTPNGPAPGVRYAYGVGDTIAAAHSKGTSGGQVLAIVVDPTKLTGDQYKITFQSDASGTAWSLTDVTTSKVVLSGQMNQSGDNDYSFVDGLQVKVMGPANGVQGDGAGMVETAYAGTPLTPAEYDAAGTPYKGNTVWHSLNNPDAANRYLISAGGGDGGFDRLIRDQVSPYNFKMVFTDTNSATPDWGWWAFDDGSVGKVPFQLWKFDPQTGDSVRLIPVLYTGTGTDPGHFKYKGTDGAFGITCTDWIYWYDDPRGYDAFAAFASAGNLDSVNTFGENEYFSRMVVCDYTGNGVIPPPGTVVKIYTNQPNTTQDEFTFTATAPTSTVAAAKEDIKMINIFPNPYYGVNSQELNKYARFVTFSHLPGTNTTIRIFNLSGIQVKEINHTNGTQYQQWDLTNESGLPVSSGLYIAYIDMPKIGATKILKFAIIQEQQIPDHF